MPHPDDAPAKADAAVAAVASVAASGSNADDGNIGGRASASYVSVNVDAAAAATWSGADHNSTISDLGNDRFFGASEEFEDSLYVLPSDADEKTRLHMQ
ncbi:hypothetical protein HK405_002054, partial [Cladochytrium tenue]